MGMKLLQFLHMKEGEQLEEYLILVQEQDQLLSFFIDGAVLWTKDLVLIIFRIINLPANMITPLAS